MLMQLNRKLEYTPSHCSVTETKTALAFAACRTPMLRARKLLTRMSMQLRPGDDRHPRVGHVATGVRLDRFALERQRMRTRMSWL